MAHKDTRHSATQSTPHNKTGSSFGVMYGLPKIHKSSIPLRPILSSYTTPNYKTAKFLATLHEPLTKNPNNLSNFLKFIENIILQDSDLYMASLDVETLFTNIPVNETIQIVVDRLFPTPDSAFNNFNSPDFRKLLELAVKDTAFVFNDEVYVQTDGVGMGSPLSCTMADIFKCHLEAYDNHSGAVSETITDLPEAFTAANAEG
ncbi:uncharacterized protein [Macrobrachium rosenbergii]|uniref:uncharacterized protein n=1 Tax=Macrobrachium rosenbergii TaxID=79674 RepID=UPI0034D588F9